MLSDHIRKMFDNLYHAWVFGRYIIGSLVMEESAMMLWVTLQSNKVKAEFAKHEIKHHPSITSIIIIFLIIAKIYETLQENIQIKKDIKMLIIKSERYYGRMAKTK